MRCHRCGTEMDMQTVSESKNRGCISILFYIILFCIPVIGWLALAYIFIKGSKVRGVTYAVCPHCGHRKKV